MDTEPPTGYLALRGDLVAILRKTCPRWLQDVVEDLAQEAVLKVWEIQQRSENRREFSPFYLRKVAHSVLVDEIRRRARRKEESLDAEVSGSPVMATRPGPERRTMSRELGRAIVECMEKMNRNRRRALVLRRLGHSAQEVADLLGWGRKQAQNRIYRGLADLRLCLASKGYSL